MCGTCFTWTLWPQASIVGTINTPCHICTVRIFVKWWAYIYWIIAKWMRSGSTVEKGVQVFQQHRVMWSGRPQVRRPIWGLLIKLDNPNTHLKGKCQHITSLKQKNLNIISAVEMKSNESIQYIFKAAIHLLLCPLFWFKTFARFEFNTAEGAVMALGLIGKSFSQVSALLNCFNEIHPTNTSTGIYLLTVRYN